MRQIQAAWDDPGYLGQSGDQTFVTCVVSVNDSRAVWAVSRAK